MAVNAQSKAPSNIDTPNLTWAVLFYDDNERRWGFKKDDGTVKYFTEVGDETLTSLSLNSNTLTYTDEAGNDTDIDLSIYLDDTNLARLVNGTLDANTGIATFSRDDGTSFTVDFSSLIDIETITTLVESPAGVFTYTSEDASTTVIDISSFESSTQLNARDSANRNRANHTGTQPASTISDFDTEVSNNVDVLANTAKVSADGSIDTHSNIDLTGLADNDILVYDSLSSTFKPEAQGANAVTSVNGQSGAVVLDADDIDDAATSNKFASEAQLDKIDFLQVTQAVDLDTLESDVSVNNAKVSNATHTGEVTGATSLALDVTAISNKADKATLSGGEEILINDAGTLKKCDAQSIADLVVIPPRVITPLHFGANFDSIGRFAVVNGRPNDADQDSNSNRINNLVIADGTLTKLAYNTENADNTTVIKIWVNGVVDTTLTLSPDSNNCGVENISISVSACDLIRIELDAGQEPDESTWYFLQELD